MSELGRRVGGPAIDVAIDDDPAADADAFDFLSRFLDRRLGKLDDPADHRIGALCCEGRLRHDAMNLGAVLSNDSGYEIRSSDVNSDDVAHPYPRWLEPLPQQ